MPKLNSQSRVLVTGGAGFIGSNLVEALLQKGVCVRILDNFSTGYEQNIQGFSQNIEVFRGDIRDRKILDQSMKGVEVVFHVAALPSVPRSIAEPILSAQINIMGSLEVLEAAREAGVRRLIFSSSSSTYGDTETLPKSEDQTPSPLSPYASHKLTIEHFGKIYTQIYQLPVVSLRYFNVYGPRQDPQSDYAAVIPRFFVAAKRNEAPVVFGDGKQTRDFSYIDDVVRANLQATEVDQAAGEVFNIAGGTSITIKDLAKKIGEISGNSNPTRHVEERSGDVKHSHASIQKAKEYLNWQPQTPLERGLEKTYQWFKEQLEF